MGTIKIEPPDNPFTQSPSTRAKMPSARSPPAKITFYPKEDLVIVAGKTFYVKEMLKKAGARWNPAGNFWTLTPACATQEFLAQLNEMVAVSIKAEKDAEVKKREDAAALAAFHRTPEGKEQWWAEIQEKKKTPAGAAAYHFICCKECEVIDWSRQHTSCKACGHGFNNFFVRGRLYTGD